MSNNPRAGSRGRPAALVLLAIALLIAAGCRKKSSSSAPTSTTSNSAPASGQTKTVTGPRPDHTKDPIPLPPLLAQNPQLKGLVALIGSEDARHWMPIRCIAFSPDGRLIASGGDDAVLRLWAGGRPIGILPGDRAQVRSVAFAADGSRVATGGADGGLRIWTLAGNSPESTRVQAHDGPVSGIAFSPDGTRLATFSGEGEPEVVLWDTSGEKPKRTGTMPGTGGLFSADGKYLSAGDKVWDVTGARPKEAAGVKATFPHRSISTGGAAAVSLDGSRQAEWTKGGAIRVKHIDAGPFLGQAELTGHIGAGHALAFSPSGMTLASGGEDGMLRLWNLAADRPTESRDFAPALAGPVRISDKAFSDDGSVFVGWYPDRKNTLEVWDLGPQSKRRATVPWTLQSETRDYAVSSDGKRLILEQKAETGDRHDLQVIDLTTNPPAVQQTLKAAFSRQVRLGFSTNGMALLASSAEGDVEVWRHDGTRYRPIVHFKLVDGVLGRIDLSLNWSVLAISDDEVMETHLFSLSDQKLASRGVVQGGSANVDPRAKTLVTRTQKQLILWDLSGEKPREIARHPIEGGSEMWSVNEGSRIGTAKAMFDVAGEPPAVSLRFLSGSGFEFRPAYDNHLLVLGKHPGFPAGQAGYRLYSVQNPTSSLTLDRPGGHYSAVRSVAAGGGRFATGGVDGSARLWYPNGAQAMEIRKYTSPMMAIALSADGKMLATGSADARVRLWDLSAGTPLELAAEIGEGLNARALAFSADDKTLAVFAADNTVRLWDLTTGQPTERGQVPAKAAALSASGRVLVAADPKGVLRVWDVASRPRERAGPPGRDPGEVAVLAVSPDGEHIAAGSMDGIRLFEPEAKDATELPGATAPVTALVFNPAGDRLAAVEGGGRVVVRDLKGTVYADWYLPGPVNGLTFSADGKQLITANNNGTAYVFAVPTRPAPAGNPMGITRRD